jgi:predicted subunit of tRNA(5-methylaminomethyl-2-thiouridylate) methyltransferase
MKKLSERAPRRSRSRAKIDNVLTFDKLTDVFNSGTMHDEDQVPHLHVADTNICADRCTVEYGNPCQYFCPAKVYEPLFKQTGENGRRRRRPAADQLLELRALQDLRHHGPVSDHHLGPAAGRRRPGLYRDVSSRAFPRARRA